MDVAGILFAHGLLRTLYQPAARWPSARRRDSVDAPVEVAGGHFEAGVRAWPTLRPGDPITPTRRR